MRQPVPYLRGLYRLVTRSIAGPFLTYTTRLGETTWFDLARKMHLPGSWLPDGTTNDTPRTYVVTMSETDHAVVITIRKDKTNSAS